MSLNFETENTKKWKLNQLENIIDQLEKRIANKVQSQQLKVAQDYLNLLLTTMGKSIITMREIICLSTLGYPDGALSLARNLYEQFILVNFFEDHKHDSNFQEYVDDFFLSYNIQELENRLYEVNKYGVDLKKMEKLEDELEQLKKAAHHTGKGDYWWAGKRSFYSIVLDVQKNQTADDMRIFLIRLHLIYKRACVSLHASCMGNDLRLGIKPKFVGIDTRPLDDGHGSPLYLATASFVLISKVVCNRLQVRNEDITKHLNELRIFFWKTMTDENNNV